MIQIIRFQLFVSPRIINRSILYVTTFQHRMKGAEHINGLHKIIWRSYNKHSLMN